MFFQSAVNAAVFPILSLYLSAYLHFSGSQTGLVMSMTAVAAFVSPLIGAFVADRIVRAERLYSLCQLLASIIMLVLSFERSFPSVLLVYLAFALVYGPSNALATAIVFHHSPDAKRGFGGLRVWGTIGWITVAWAFGFLWLRAGGGGHEVIDRLPGSLRLASITSLTVGMFAFALPARAVPSRSGPPTFLPLESIRILRRPAILLFLLFSLLEQSMDSYYYFGTSLFLRHLGYGPGLILPLMSLGQMTEIVTMVLLGRLLGRLPFRAMFAIGASAELARFAIFFVGAPPALVIAGLAMHGIAFAGFFGSAYIYLDLQSTPSARAGVQQLFAIATGGFGSLLGNLLVGRMLDLASAGAGGTSWRLFWAVPAGIAVVVIGGILAFLREVRPRETGTPARKPQRTRQEPLRPPRAGRPPLESR